MRICLLADPRSVHIQRLAPGLAERGHTVHLLCRKPAAVPGISVEPFRVPGPGLTNLRKWHGRLEHYLRSLLKRFDVVNVHFLDDWGLTPDIMRHGCVVASPWGSDIVDPPGENSPPPALTASRLSLIRHADAVTAWGPTFAGVVATFAGIDADRVDVAPLGVDLGLFDPDGHLARGGPGPRRVGFFKGFREVYGPTCLIRAIPMVLRHLPGTRFDLIGDGPQRVRCKQLAAELDVESFIEWIPRQPYHQIPHWLGNWDLTAIPSICESFGAAALESLAMCVPVVASNVGGLPDTVRDGETGLLVPPGSPEALAEAIVALLSDDRRRTRMGMAGREWVRKEYNWPDVLDRWEHVLTRACDRASVMV